MLKYQEYLQDRFGNAIPNAQILVQALGTGIAAPTYADSGAVTVQANPTTSNADGYFSFHAAAGHYTLIITLPDGGTRTIADVFLAPDATSVGTTGNLNFALLTPDDGGTSASASLATAIISALPIAVTKVTTGTYLLTVNATITKALWGMGGVLKVANGVTLTLNCPIYCPDGTPLFDLSLGGTLAGTPKVSEFVANWIVGCDPTYTSDSAAAIQAAITLCTATTANTVDTKPDVRILAGRYKILSTISKPISIACPKIIGTSGGTTVANTATHTASLNGVVFDARESTIAPLSAILELRGASGEASTGGVYNIKFIGNQALFPEAAACMGLQISGMTGLTVDNCSFDYCAIGLSLFIWQYQGTAGAVEWCVIRHCHFLIRQWGVYLHVDPAVIAQGNAHLPSPAFARSFHGTRFEDCWFNFFGGGRSAFVIGDSVLWYNGYLDCIFFYFFGIILRQYGFIWEATGGSNFPIQLAGGAIRSEGGIQFIDGSGEQVEMTARHACEVPDPYTVTIVGTALPGLIYYGGSVHGLAGVHHGNLYQVDSSFSLGFESIGNGLTYPIHMKPYGHNSLVIDGRTTGVTTIGHGVFRGGTCHFVDLIIECYRTAFDVGPPIKQGGSYYERHTFFLQLGDNNYVTHGRVIEPPRSPMFGSAVAGPVTINSSDAEVRATVTVTGAALGDKVVSSFSLDLNEVALTSSVVSANTVEAIFTNLTGESRAPGSGTVSSVVTKVVTATVDPGILADGGNFTSTAIAVTGVALGTPVGAAFNVDIAGITLTGYVSSSGNIKVVFQNESGGPLTLGSHTITVTTTLTGTATFDPGTLLDNRTYAVNIAVPGARTANFVQVTCSRALNGCTLSGEVISNDVVKAVVTNNTGVPFGLLACNIYAKVDFDRGSGWTEIDSENFGPCGLSANSAGDLLIANNRFPCSFQTVSTSNVGSLSHTVTYEPQVASGTNGDVDTVTNAFTVGVLPSYQVWQTGQPVLFTLASGTITNLTTATTYYVIRVDALHIQLATSLDDAYAGTEIVLPAKATPVWSIELTPIEREDMFQYETHYGVLHTTTVSSVDVATHTVVMRNKTLIFTAGYAYAIDIGTRFMFAPVTARFVTVPYHPAQQAVGVVGYTHGGGAAGSFR